jgi:hypothetical protein
VRERQPRYAAVEAVRGDAQPALHDALR